MLAYNKNVMQRRKSRFYLNNCFLWCWFDQLLSFDVIIIVGQLLQWILIIICFLSDMIVWLILSYLKIIVAEVVITLLGGLDISGCV